MISVENLVAAIQNTPNGGRLSLINSEVYAIPSTITITKDIIIDGNNATLTGNGRINFTGNAEIQNTTFERVAIALSSAGGKDIKIINNKFKNIYDNAIESWTSLNSLIIQNNTIDGAIVSTGTDKNFNNSGSFIYLNGGKINFLRIQTNRVLNVGGGTSIFMSGNYPDLDVSDNIIDTMAQRAIGFWATIYAKGTVSRNRILKCGVLKAPGLGPGGEGAGVGCNAIYSNGNTWDVEVLNNYVEYVYENGIEGNYKSIKRNTIINTGMDLVNYPTPSYEGIFYSGKDAVIEDNTLINCMGHGIYTYIASQDFTNISIKRNKIVNDVFHTASAICFRSPSNQNVTNVHISDNHVNNYSTVIELPNGKRYTDVKIGKHTAINSETLLSNFFGEGIDIEELGINKGNLIKNGNFNVWDATANKVLEWQSKNAALTLATDELKKSAKITANDQYNGRITQTIAGGEHPEKTGKRFAQLVVRVKGNNNLFVRLYTLDENGIATGATPLGLSARGLSETTFKTFKIRIPYQPNFELELCNSGGVGSWIEISEAYAFLIESEETANLGKINKISKEMIDDTFVNEVSSMHVQLNNLDEHANLVTGQLAKTIRIKDSSVYVKDFGAVGNNTTDDREKIQNAINYAAANGIRGVIFEQGVYFIGSHGGTYNLPSDNGTASPSFRANGDTNITAEKTNRIRYGLSIPQNIRLIGIGEVTLKGSFKFTNAINITAGNTTDGGDTINDMACLLIRPGDPYAEALYTSLYMENISLDSFLIGMISNGILGGITAGKCLENVRVNNCGIAGVLRGVDNAIFEKVSLYDCYAGFVVGGWWTHRNRSAYTLSNLPPYPGHDVVMTGWVDFFTLRDVRQFNFSINYDTLAKSIDSFYDKYFFKSANSPIVTNGGRRTINSDDTYSDSYVHDYPGIYGRTMVCFNRYGRLIQNVTTSNFKTIHASRDVVAVYGRSAYCTAQNFYTEINGYSNRENKVPMINSDVYAPIDRNYLSARNLNDIGNLYHFDSASVLPSNRYKTREILFQPTLFYNQVSGSPNVKIADGYGRALYQDGVVNFELYIVLNSYTKLGYNAYASRLRIDGLPFTPRKSYASYEETTPLAVITQAFFDTNCVAKVKQDGILELVNPVGNTMIAESHMKNISEFSMLYCSGSFIANRA